MMFFVIKRHQNPVMRVNARGGKFWLMIMGLFFISNSSNAAEWQVTDTGITSPIFSWCNSDILLARWATSLSPPTHARALIDTNNPATKTPVTFMGKADFEVVDCVSSRVIIEVRELATSVRHLELYSIQLGKGPELLAWAFGNFSGGSRRVSKNGSVIAIPSRSNYRESNSISREHCAEKVNGHVQVVCTDENVRFAVSVESGVIGHYVWSQNAEPPAITGLRGESGIRNAWLLYDSRGSVIARLDKDSDFRPDLLGYAISPDESYLYAPCKRLSPETTVRGTLGVCRYPLQGRAGHWEEVFRLRESGWKNITKVSVDNGGNIYFARPALLGENGGIWRFDAATKDVARIVTGNDSLSYSEPAVSEDGSKLAFLRNYVLFIAKRK